MHNQVYDRRAVNFKLSNKYFQVASAYLEVKRYPPKKH